MPAGFFHGTRTALIALVVSILPVTALAQTLDLPQGKLDARLQMMLSAASGGAGKALPTLSAGPEDWVDVFVEGDVDGDLLREHGASPGTELPGLATARIPLARVEALARSSRVSSIRAAQPVYPLLDKNRVETEVLNYWGASPPSFPSAGFTGAGVIVGIVDTGIDFKHLDFKNGTNTRVLYIWDQNAGGGTRPPGFTYGQQWTASQINSNLSTQMDLTGHGTHVAGVAAGNGRATGNGKAAYRYVGMAPEADLVVVKLAGGNDAQVLDGVNYIFQRAAALNRKAVVCVAVGKQSGPHDGTDLLNKGIDALCGPGKIVVAAAGNEGKTKIHSRLRPAKGQTLRASFTVPAYTLIGQPFIELEGWFNSGQLLTVKLISPSGYALGPLNVGTNLSMSNPDGWSLIQWTVPVTGPREIFCTINTPVAGTWTIEVKNVGTTNAVVDFWLTNFLLSQNKVPTMVLGQNDSCCVASPASATQVIAAAAYTAKKSWTSQTGQTISYTGAVLNQIADFSSFGPRRDGVAKPDIAASGYGCASARATTATFSGTSIVDDGVHVMMTGTSVAAGVTAGAVALLLEENPTLTPAGARTLLQTRANKDSYTGFVSPHARWGWGKLSVSASQSAVADLVPQDGRLQLGRPYPNPLHRATTLPVSLEQDALLSASVFDVSGRQVRLLQAGPVRAGEHVVTWDGRDNEGREAPSGRYFIAVSAAVDSSPAQSENRAAGRMTLQQSRAVTLLR